MARDQWRELCDAVAEDDGLPTWEEANFWTKHKLYFWHRYIDITTPAMRNKPAFPQGLVYVDLFAGSGICTLKDTKERIPGSTLIAARASAPFARIIACEENPDSSGALRDRLDKTLVKQRCHVLTGDCNDLVDQVVALIPQGTLTLAFIDPKGLDAHFETIAALSRERRVDFVVLFADAYDIVRNVDLYERQETQSKLDRVLGTTSWRERWEQVPNRSGVNVRRFFAEIYKEQLEERLGYTQFGEKTIYGDHGPLYRLIYASKHELGLKFWNEAIKKDASGQRELF